MPVYWIFFLPAPIVVARKKILDLIKFYQSASLVFFSETDLFISFIMPGPMGICILNAKRVPYSMTSVLEVSVFSSGLMQFPFSCILVLSLADKIYGRWLFVDWQFHVSVILICHYKDYLIHLWVVWFWSFLFSYELWQHFHSYAFLSSIYLVLSLITEMLITASGCLFCLYCWIHTL